MADKTTTGGHLRMRYGVVLIILPFLWGCMRAQREFFSQGGGGGPYPVPSGIVHKWATLGAEGLDFRIDPRFSRYFDKNDVDSNGYNPIEQMMVRWNDEGVLIFQLPARPTVLREKSRVEDYLNDGEMGIYLHSQWFQNNPKVSANALGVTQYRIIRWQVGTSQEWAEMVHADIIINTRFYQFSTSPDPSYTNIFDLLSVALHELGHASGIGHVGDARAVMYPYLSEIEVKRELDPLDSQAFGRSYPEREQTGGLMALSPHYRWRREGVSAPSTGIIELRPDGQCVHRTISSP